MHVDANHAFNGRLLDALAAEGPPLTLVAATKPEVPSPSPPPDNAERNGSGAGGAAAHAALLDTLNGTHLLFVGGAASRAQYLVLAHELLEAAPPVVTSPLLDLAPPRDWPAFFAATSRALARTPARPWRRAGRPPPRAADEACFCARLTDTASGVEERRSFAFDDGQVRTDASLRC